MPLPLKVVRHISLENHIAFDTLLSGRGTAEAMCVLLRAIYMFFFMIGGGVEVSSFLRAEAALESSIRLSMSGWELRVDERCSPNIRAMLLRFDEVLTKTSLAHYRASCRKLTAFSRSSMGSPLPGSRVAISLFVLARM
ncbi:hypothetical protein [Burkholderia cepacia]|uniref:hypothetical protein n=1 Tax=Burkholderia cepacia TaxID=292 RepID=UPI0012D97E9F|nr:hypothetical protein [Burkholderia cepacia]